MTTTKIDSLEGLRGIMALWVWVSHITTMSTLPFEKHEGVGWILANGDFAVAVFVILSGFVISLSLRELRRESFTPRAYGSFLIRRGFRLFPIYLIALYVSVVLLQPSLAALQQLPWEGPRTAGRIQQFQDTLAYYWQHLTLHTFLLHGVVPDRILPNSSFAFIGQAWSLTLEWQFYLAAPFAVVLLGNFRLTHTLHLVTLIITIALSKVFGQPSFLASFLFLFAIGYFAQRLLQELRDGVLSTRQVLGFVAVEAILLTVTGANFFAFLIWAAVYIGIILSMDGKRLPWLTLLETRPLQWLGNISYSFYCLHMAVMYGFVYVLIVKLGLQDRGLYIAIMIPGTLLVSLLLSHLTFHTVEKPMQQYGKRLAANLAARRRAAGLKPGLAE